LNILNPTCGRALGSASIERAGRGPPLVREVNPRTSRQVGAPVSRGASHRTGLVPFTYGSSGRRVLPPIAGRSTTRECRDVLGQSRPSETAFHSIRQSTRVSDIGRCELASSGFRPDDETTSWRRTRHVPAAPSVTPFGLAILSSRSFVSANLHLLRQPPPSPPALSLPTEVSLGVKAAFRLLSRYCAPVLDLQGLRSSVHSSSRLPPARNPADLHG